MLLKEVEKKQRGFEILLPFLRVQTEKFPFVRMQPAALKKS